MRDVSACALDATYEMSSFETSMSLKKLLLSRDQYSCQILVRLQLDTSTGTAVPVISTAVFVLVQQNRHLLYIVLVGTGTVVQLSTVSIISYLLV